MKKYLSIALCLVAASCTIVEPDQPQIQGDQTVFTGSFEVSKITIGAKEGTVYKALWESTDVLSVYQSPEMTLLGTATLVSGVGQNTGVFSMPGSIQDGTSVVLAYGNGGVTTEQTQAKAGDSSLASYTTAKSAVVTVNGGTASFTLVHDPAIVKVSVSSSELSGATVKNVILRSCGKALSGTDKDYVKLTLTTPLTLGSTAQDVWMTANPVDLTGNEVDVAFVVTKDSETYTLPVGFAGKELKANNVNSFTVSGLSDAKCVCWYEPHDTRLMAGAGYAYGDANTFLIQCKDGNTYAGATYEANASIPEEVAISIKARGDFLQVVNPIGATFEWAKLGPIAEGKYNGTGAVYTARTDMINGCDPTKYEFSYDKNTTVTVKNTGAYAGSPILYMVKGGKILWAWTFWNIAADGTQLKATSFGLANMYIGQCTNQYNTWGEKAAVRNTANFYQWGRFMPIFMQSYWTTRFVGADKAGNVPAVSGPVSMADALSNPVGVICSTVKNTDINIWSTEKKGDLWGCTPGKTDVAGTKSNYDPCPKGWRVADAKTWTAVQNAVAEGTVKVSYQTADKVNGIFLSSDPDDLILNMARVDGKISTDDGRLATYGFNGGNGRAWTNYISGDTASSATAFMFHSGAAATATSGGNFRTCTHVRTSLCPVRCQVDNDNR